ncbi:MAG: exodeoxyribonuclease VII small subunit [Oscillospiraceae bacterium]|nr:exodeoxyribonuclease VII small subunit [Oscillospiraceae bacterium]
MTFEQQLSRLEEIVNLLETTNPELSSAMTLFEEGVRLSADCDKQLKEAELKITRFEEARETDA